MRTRSHLLFCVAIFAVGLVACSKSATRLEEECSRREAESCYTLGRMYVDGNTVAQDKEKAVQLFEQACEAGESKGCDGARQTYREACDAGNALACSGLAMHYLDGFAVAQDAARAAELYEMACDQAEAISCSSLAMLYVEGRGVARDTEKAVELWKKACELGFTDACQKAPEKY